MYKLQLHPPKINIEPENHGNDGPWKMIFFFQGCILRFQSLIFRGVLWRVAGSIPTSPTRLRGGNGVIGTPSEIGWVGREGLFFIPNLVSSDITWAAEYFKFFEPRIWAN